MTKIALAALLLTLSPTVVWGAAELVDRPVELSLKDKEVDAYFRRRDQPGAKETRAVLSAKIKQDLGRELADTKDEYSEVENNTLAFYFAMSAEGPRRVQKVVAVRLIWLAEAQTYRALYATATFAWSEVDRFFDQLRKEFPKWDRAESAFEPAYATLPAQALTLAEPVVRRLVPDLADYGVDSRAKPKVVFRESETTIFQFQNAPEKAFGTVEVTLRRVVRTGREHALAFRAVAFARQADPNRTIGRLLVPDLSASD